MKIKEASDKNKDEIASKMELTFPNRYKWIHEESPKASSVIDEFPKLTAYKGAMVCVSI